MDHMDFREIGTFISEHQFSLGIIGGNTGIPFVHLVHPLSSTITQHREYCVTDVRRTTGHLREPGSPTSEYRLPYGSLL